MFWRSWALWLLGYPEAALSDAEYSLKDAREIWPSGHLDVCAAIYIGGPCPLRKVRDGKGAIR